MENMIMTTYRRPYVKFVGAIAIGFHLVSLFGVINAFVIDDMIALFGVLLMWLFLGFLFTFIWIYEGKSILQISPDEVRFFYKVFSKSKGLRGFNRSGLEIRKIEIKSVTLAIFPGDGFVAATTKSLLFELIDGRSFQAYFYHYGKNQETEIIARLLDFNTKK
jgi:hypothetical protein